MIPRPWTEEIEDIDLDVCQCCGRIYSSPHHKEQEWLASRLGLHHWATADHAATCPRCWDE